MVVVYLDQNYFTRMARACLGLAGDEAAIGLLARLWSLVESGRLVCPFSASHVWETADYTNDDVRNELASIVDRLSAGRCLKDFVHRLRSELHELLRSEAEPAQPGFIADPIGYGADCFRDVTPEDNINVMMAAPGGVFRLLVDVIRADQSLRERFRVAKLMTERAVEATRPMSTNSTPAALHEEIRAHLESDLLSALLVDVAKEHGMDAARARDLVERDGLANMPTLRAVVWLRTVKDRELRTTPGLVDMRDATYISASGAVDVIAVDSGHLSLAANGAQMEGTKIVGSIAEILAALDVLTGAGW